MHESDFEFYVVIFSFLLTDATFLETLAVRSEMGIKIEGGLKEG